MVFDPASPSSSSVSGLRIGALDDVPPSYDSIATESVGGDDRGEGSSSSAPAWPATMNSFFASPPHPEQLMTRDRAARQVTYEPWRSYAQSLEFCDPRLDDPSALFDFIRAQTLQIPTIKIRCAASRTEVADRQQTVMQNGLAIQVQAGQKYMVHDFNFTIDLTPVYGHEDSMENIHLLVEPDNKAARRGDPHRGFGNGQRATHSQKRMWDEFAKYRRERGKPMWADPSGDDEFWTAYNPKGGSNVALASTPANEDEERLLGSAGDAQSLRHWCAVYGKDPGLLKSFTLKKDVWGWDLANLRHAVERAIFSTGYQATDDGHITVEYVYGADTQIIVRPSNFLSRFYHNSPWYLIVFFFWVYPIIWIWYHLDRANAGGPYEVAVASYGMKVYPPLPSTYPNETVENAQHRLPSLYKLHPELPRNAVLVKGPKGVHYLLGRREGEWFREWEERIRMAVRMRYSGELTDTRLEDENEPPELDGY